MDRNNKTIKIDINIDSLPKLAFAIVAICVTVAVFVVGLGAMFGVS